MKEYLRFRAFCHAMPAPVRRGFVVLCCMLSAWSSGNAAHAALRGQPSEAIEIFQCGFDARWDQNYDHWPDRWIRKSDTNHPHYVEVQIRDDEDAAIGPYLEIDLDGASAAVSSPPIRVMSRFSYVLKAKLKLSGVKFSEVTLSIAFYDAASKLLQTESRRIEPRGDDWQKISLTSIDPVNEAIDRAVISLEVKRVGRGDLKGKVCLDDVWLARLPRITVSTNRPYNVYRDRKDVVVRCELSGIREKNPEIRFQLLDAASKEIKAEIRHLDGRLIVEDTRKASEIVDGIGIATKGYEGAIEWQPGIPDHGFYRVVVTMLSSNRSDTQRDNEREIDRREIWLAVVPPLPMPAKGDFGWSLPDADSPLSFQDLSALLPHVGINWVKVPVWYSASDTQRGDAIIRFVEMLAASNIEAVGVIDRPPADSDLGRQMDIQSSIGDLLSADPTLWTPALDPVMSRLSMRLRYWQLGNDRDTSFVGSVNLGKRIGELRDKLFRFGQEVKLGLAWTWDGAGPATRDPTWEFEQLTPDPSLSLEEFEKLISRPRNNSLLQWVTIEPPPRADGSSLSEQTVLESRATLFVHKLVAAKVHGADGIFISEPFNDRNGLMRDNGMPGELLLPWRTCAAMLSGAKFLGTIQLPNGSENRVFGRSDGQVVMVVWSAEPTQETLYLGNDVRQIDVWGGATVPASDGHRQVVQIGPLPTFVFGLSEPIARWRMALRFDHDHVESIFAKPHPNGVYFKNFFPQGVGGTMTIVATASHETDAAASDEPVEHHNLDSDRWSIDPPQASFSLAAGEEANFPFEVRLKNAIFGEQPIRVDFVVDADEPYRFSVYRTMWVGSGDVTIDMKTHLDKDGTLVVEQFMTSNAGRLVDFKCYLYAKGHRRQRAQVYRLGSTPDRTVYRYPDGAELLGKELLLEAEEVGGERVLKFRVVVTDEAPPDESAAPAPLSPTDATADAQR